VTAPGLGPQIGQAIAGLTKVEIPGVDSANALIDGIDATRRWMSDRHNWIRVMWFGAGMILMIGGAMIISRPAISKTAGTVAAVAPVGKIGKVAKAVK
jgi:hypothetical protein